MSKNITIFALWDDLKSSECFICKWNNIRKAATIQAFTEKGFHQSFIKYQLPLFIAGLSINSVITDTDTFNTISDTSALAGSWEQYQVWFTNYITRLMPSLNYCYIGKDKIPSLCNLTLTVIPTRFGSQSTTPGSRIK